MLARWGKSLVCSSRGLRDGKHLDNDDAHDRRFCAAAAAAALGVSFQRRGRRNTIHQPIMSAASRGNGAVSALLRSEFPPYFSHHELIPLTTPFPQTDSRRICSHCATRPPTTPLTRAYSAEATATTTPTETTTPDSPAPHAPPSRYRIKAGLILSRPPLLTRAPTPFESSFYLYQKRLNERLAAPFRAALYFPTDTARALDWRLKLRERHGVAAKDIGRYNPRGRVAWNDEVLAGSATSTPEYVVERLLADAEVRVSEDGEEISAEERTAVERPALRRSVADEEGDVRRLDRRMEETVYLVVKRPVGEDGEGGEWVFPAGDVTTSEALHEVCFSHVLRWWGLGLGLTQDTQTAKRMLAESAGVNMNTWIVGRVPIAHHIAEFGDETADETAPAAKEADADATTASDKSRYDGEKIFFLKGRIMAGQVDLTGNKYGYTDFKWVNKDELRQTLPYEYWRSVRNMVELR